MTMANSIDMMKMEETSDYRPNVDRMSHASGSNDDRHSGRDPGVSNYDADYWFGRKYFECTIAQDVFTRVDVTTTYSSIDAEFEKAVRCFPYATASSAFVAGVSPTSRLKYLPAINDSYKNLVTVIGATMRIGTTQEKRQMIDILRRFYNPRSSFFNETDTAYRFADPPLQSENSPVHRDGSPPNDSQNDLASFTSMLHEIAITEGIQPEYKIKRDTDNPSFWKCILSYGGCTFEGVDRSRKVAKHKASRDACQFLQGQQGHMS